MAEVLVEEDATAAVLRDERLTHEVDPAQGRLAVTFQLADDGAGVQVVPTGQPEALGEHPEVDAVVGVAIEDGVHGTVDVQQHAVPAAPVGQRGVRREPGRQEVVDQRDWYVQAPANSAPVEHVLHGPGRHVQVVALALPGFGLRLLDRLGHELEPVPPAHERLRVDVLVVLGEVEPATQALIHRAAVVLRRQAELRLDRAAEHRSAVLVQLVALDDDPVLAGPPQVSTKASGNRTVLQPERANGLGSRRHCRPGRSGR